MATDFTGTPVQFAEVEEVVPVLPAGIYPARFAAIEQRSNDQGAYWYWTFIAQHDGADVEITATSSNRITPRTKAAKWLAGLGQSVEVGSAIDFGALLDTPCQLVVIISQEGYSRIDSVLPSPR